MPTQSTDVENAKGPLSVKTHSRDGSTTQRGSAQKIAREDSVGQQHITGKGGKNPGATIR